MIELEFLTYAELIKLTGYRGKAKQAKQLAEQGIQFFLSGIGEPVVNRHAVRPYESPAPDYGSLGAVPITNEFGPLPDFFGS